MGCDSPLAYTFNDWYVYRELGDYKHTEFSAAKPRIAFQQLANLLGLETYEHGNEHRVGSNSTALVLQYKHTVTVHFRSDRERAIIKCIASIEPHDPTTFVKWFSMGADGYPVSSDLPLEGTSPKDEFYPWLPTTIEDFAEDFLTSSSNVLLLIGPPGTGKTSFIRGMCRHFGYETWLTYDEQVQRNEQFYVNFASVSDSDVETPSFFGNTRLSDLRKLNRQNGRVLILEDADELLGSRQDGNKIMSRLLNLSDGLVSLPARKLIFSTNLPSLSSVDEALLRPGRCYGVVNFRRLTKAEALRAQSAVGREVPITKSEVTLSEALNGSTKNGETIRQIGF